MEKYEADKVLEVGNKIKELKRTHEWFLELASHSPAMHEHLKYDILTVKHGDIFLPVVTQFESIQSHLLLL
jgi:hypothetical protein